METQLGIKIEKEDRAKVKAAAKSLGLGISSFGRMVLLKESKKVLSELKECDAKNGSE